VQGFRGGEYANYSAFAEGGESRGGPVTWMDCSARARIQREYQSRAQNRMLMPRMVHSSVILRAAMRGQGQPGKTVVLVGGVGSGRSGCSSCGGLRGGVARLRLRRGWRCP
jgi:hypothetical protein